jgi:hypothetical protein
VIRLRVGIAGFDSRQRMGLLLLSAAFRSLPKPSGQRV